MADTPITTETALFPAELLSISPIIVQEPSKPAVLPEVTTGTSERYIQGLASAVSRASATDPLTVMFQGEKLPPGQTTKDVDLATMQRIVYDSAITRLTAKIAAGGFVVEAGGFAAVACWEPGRAGDPHRMDVSTAAVSGKRPLFKAFVDRVTELMRVHLYPIAERVSAGRYWKLSLMARDPAVEYVPGAVRAVLVPFMERFTSDQNEGGAMPVWLEAGNERARDIYAHFGFREVGEIITGGVKTWGMIYTGNINVEKIDTKTGF
ncbi:hypothetical protein F5Y00DRAFT_269238 [Daldinia vernicosa]|uniref:uncharacterized protein n=1 Tax=Daldinia vernicosa TaxID=114800 RepID=UPI002008A86F|nr:uncharacterized protein F5Y00DRAFT_269238 [Daldinia vernicosa]KAI0853878.1 hypothetical protein F5Y00DRAFT_269238 [Daldinia vernicosa]